MNYQFSVNVRSNEHLAKSHEHDIRDDSDSAEDDHSFYPSRPPTVSYYGLPYLDHTYGAPWPPSPPPSVAAPPILAVPRINGHIDIDNVSYHAEVCTTAVDLDPDNQYADSVTRCICGYLHDDGYMICCDKCGVWQHVDCMGVEREHIPEVYLCDVCQPRYVDRRKAILIQRKRYELMTGAVDVEAVDVGNDGPQLPLARDLNSMVPLSPLPPHSHPASHPGPRPHQAHVKMLQRSVQLSAGLKPVYRPKFNRGSRKVVNGTATRRSNGKYSTDEDFDDDESYGHYRGRNGTVENKSRDVNVAELPDHVNTYSNDVAALLRAHRHLNGQQQQQLLTWQSISEKLLPLSRHLCRAVAVAGNTKGLQVLEDVETSRPLIEYTGSVKIDDDDSVFSSKRLQPFVLVYAKFESARLRIESGATDSDAKFVRRSCKPNAEIRHLSDNSAVRLFVFSSRPIFRGQEITIPYDMDYSESETFVCACGRDPCPLLKSTRRFSRTGRRKKSERESVELSVDVSEEDEDAKVTGTVAGGRRRRQDSGHDLPSLPRSPPPPATNGNGGTLASRRRTSDEDQASRHDAQPYNGSASSNRRRKKSLGSSDDDATTAAAKVEDATKRSAKRNVERRISVSEKSKPVVEKEDKKPKVTLEHSVSCTSPVKDGADSCFGDRRMSREERKLEAIMKAFERLEQQQTVKRRDSISKADGKTPGKVEIKEEIEEEVDKRPSLAASRLKKTFDSRKPGAKKIHGRRRPWLTLKRSTSKNSNASTNSNRRSPVSAGRRVTSATAPCTPATETPATALLAGMPFKFPKTKKAMMSEWMQERTTSRGEQRRRSLDSGDNERSVLGVGETGDDDEAEDMDKYVNYIQTPSRHVDVLKNVRRTSTSSGSSKGSPASLYHLQQQQAEFGAGSAKKRWLRQVMHETGDGDGVGNVPPSPGAVSLSVPHQSPAVERQTPLKKRRFTRESTGDEAETLLSLANSVPAMEYEQLEKTKAAGDSAAVNLTPSLDSDVPDNLFERFSAHRRLTLAEQLLALSGSSSEMESARCEVVDATMSTGGGGDTKPGDGMLLLLAGIEQVAARERANSQQPADNVPPPATCDTAILSDDTEGHHQQQHHVTFADDAVRFADNTASSLPPSFDSSAIGLLAELSETVLQHSVASAITDRQQLLVGRDMISTAETVDSCHSNDNATAPGSWTSLTTFIPHRTSFTADETLYATAHGSADASVLHGSDALVDTDSNSADHAGGFNSAHERKKVSLADYRSRMRGRSSSTQSKAPISPTPGDSLAAVSHDDTVSSADETSAGSCDGSNARHDSSGEWSAEATAAEKLREHSNYHSQHWLHVDQSAAKADGEQLVDRRVEDQSTELLHADV